MTAPKKAVPARTYQNVRAADINIDPRYQRTLNRQVIKQRAERFEPLALGVIVLSCRADGSIWAVDGQHRVELVKLVGKPDMMMKAEVHRNLTLSDEAQLFVKLNDKTNVRAIDNFIARVAGREPVALSIATCCDENGLTLARSSQDGTICCVGALEAVYEGRGLRGAASRTNIDVVGLTLNTAVEAWGQTAAAVNGSIIHGLGLFLLRFGDAVDQGRLVDRLAAFPAGAAGLLGKARGVKEFSGSTLPHCVADRVTAAYNKGLRSNQLPEWRTS